MSETSGFFIKELFAFVAVDSDGDEGIMAARVGDTWMPLVAADSKRVESLRPMAKQLVTLSGEEAKLVRFSVREEIEEFKPEA